MHLVVRILSVDMSCAVYMSCQFDFSDTSLCCPKARCPTACGGREKQRVVPSCFLIPPTLLYSDTDILVMSEEY